MVNDCKDRLALPPRQYMLITKLLELGGAVTASELANAVGRKQSDIMRDLAELEARGLVRVERRVERLVRLSDCGVKYLTEGLPEERLLKLLRESGGSISLREAFMKSGLSKDELTAALGRLRRFKVALASKGVLTLLEGEGLREFEEYVTRVKEALKALYGRHTRLGSVAGIDELRKRKMIEVEDIKELYVRATDKLRRAYSEGRICEAKVITRLTSDDIRSGSWREAIFKEFDLSIEIPLKHPRRKNPYIEFLNFVREVVESMGFTEVKGPHVEAALWNFDALFVPQYHPSRRETDVYILQYSSRYTVSVPEDVMRRTREVHEGVWRYRWDPRRALELVLRTHTTPVSLRTIYRRGGGEYRVYSLDRVFRPDTPDATHLMEFHQLEGIIVGRSVRFKHLLGFFKELSRRLGLGEVKFRPAYFPFTEPSVEGYVKHPKLGWIEVFPGGMFRPEVLYAVGLSNHNVAAWGIGIDRIAMMVLGIDDIRNLYSNDVEVIRRMPTPWEVIG